MEKKVEFRPLPLAPGWHLFSAEARGVEGEREELGKVDPLSVEKFSPFIFSEKKSTK